MRRANDIPASIINLRLNVAEQYGANKELVLQDSGISSQELSSPANRISVEKTMGVWRSIIKQTNNHNIGLDSGAKINLSSLGILGYVMMNSSSLLKAFNKLCTYQRLVNSISFYRKEEDGSTVTFRLELQVEWQDMFRYTFDFMHAAIYSIFKNGTTNDVEPITIGFGFPKPSNSDYYNDLFGSSKVLFDTQYSFIKYRKRQLEASFIGYSNDLFDHFEKQLVNIAHEHDNINVYGRKVKTYIQKHLHAEIPSIKEIAQEMAMSVRALQLALKKEGLTYQIILNDVRKELSINQLRNSKFNITEVAFIAGFSDVSVFSRKFKTWTGMTPSEFQAQQHR